MNISSWTCESSDFCHRRRTCRPTGRMIPETPPLQATRDERWLQKKKSELNSAGLEGQSHLSKSGDSHRFEQCFVSNEATRLRPTQADDVYTVDVAQLQLPPGYLVDVGHARRVTEPFQLSWWRIPRLGEAPWDLQSRAQSRSPGRPVRGRLQCSWGSGQKTPPTCRQAPKTPRPLF